MVEINQYIKETIADGNDSSAIKALQNGRRNAMPSVEEYIQQIDPTLHDVMDESKRPDKWVKADDGEDGLTVQQLQEEGVTINVTGMQNSQRVRKEKVARISIAIQQLIVKRAVAFTFGNPVTLNCEPKDEAEEGVLNTIKAVMHDAKTRTLNRRIAREIYSATEAAELWYVVKENDASDRYGFESKFKLRAQIFSPLYGDKLYPYFDEKGDMVAFSREYTIKDSEGKSFHYFETYTAEQLLKWQQEENTWKMCEGYPMKNQLGKIPVIYGQQPKVEWAYVQGLIDRLETLLSNFADTNDYHASPKIVVKGDIIGWSRKGDSGSIIEMDENGSAEYLTWSQAPESVKLEIDTLLRMIYTITQTPDISFDSVKGIGSVSGVALRLLFMDAHLKVQDKMEIFDDYLQRRINVVKAFLGTMDNDRKGVYNSIVIEPEIEPYMLRDESSEISDLSAAISAGIASKRTGVTRLGWVNDVDAEMEAIDSESTASRYMDITEPTV